MEQWKTLLLRLGCHLRKFRWGLRHCTLLVSDLLYVALFVQNIHLSPWPITLPQKSSFSFCGKPLITYLISRVEERVVQCDFQCCTRESSHLCLAPCTCPSASVPPKRHNSCSCAVSARTPLRCKVGQPLPQLKIMSFIEIGFRTVIKKKEKKRKTKTTLCIRG